MRVLLAHNQYQIAGGEDAVVRNEQSLLRRHGHYVRGVLVNNDNIVSLAKRLKAAWNVSYSGLYKSVVTQHIAALRPDVVHVHNFFPLLTPAIYDACAEQNVPVVQTLHNYRLMCVRGDFLRKGTICEDCLGGSAYQAVLHGCYRGSRLGSLAVAHMIESHRRKRTWATKVDRFIALTQFARQKFIAAGLPPERVVVKPNFVDDPGRRLNEGTHEHRTALFVGRLSGEKGIDTLIKAWRRLPLRLVVAGDGPSASAFDEAGLSNVIRLGAVPSWQVSASLQEADFLVVPSVWYETFGMVIIEAFAHGVPVIGSRIGAIAELVEDGVTGRLFAPGDADDLVATVEWAIDNPHLIRGMGRRARTVYEQKFSPDTNYRQLMSIYTSILDGS